MDVCGDHPALAAAAGLARCLFKRQRGRGAARSVEPADLLCLCVVEEEEGVTADARRARLGHVETRRHRHRRIHRIAALPQDAVPRLGRQRLAARHHRVRSVRTRSARHVWELYFAKS